jgi:hypothetical protein
MDPSAAQGAEQKKHEKSGRLPARISLSKNCVFQQTGLQDSPMHQRCTGRRIL